VGLVVHFGGLSSAGKHGDNRFLFMAWNLLISLIINEILENHLPAPN